jgi:hypothetical protein
VETHPSHLLAPLPMFSPIDFQILSHNDPPRDLTRVPKSRILTGRTVPNLLTPLPTTGAWRAFRNSQSSQTSLGGLFYSTRHWTTQRPKQTKSYSKVRINRESVLIYIYIYDRPLTVVERNVLRRKDTGATKKENSGWNMSRKCAVESTNEGNCLTETQGFHPRPAPPGIRQPE